MALPKLFSKTTARPGTLLTGLNVRAQPTLGASGISTGVLPRPGSQDYLARASLNFEHPVRKVVGAEDPLMVSGRLRGTGGHDPSKLDFHRALRDTAPRLLGGRSTAQLPLADDLSTGASLSNGLARARRRYVYGQEIPKASWLPAGERKTQDPRTFLEQSARLPIDRSREIGGGGVTSRPVRSLGHLMTGGPIQAALERRGHTGLANLAKPVPLAMGTAGAGLVAAGLTADSALKLNPQEKAYFSAVADYEAANNAARATIVPDYFANEDRDKHLRDRIAYHSAGLENDRSLGEAMRRHQQLYGVGGMQADKGLRSKIRGALSGPDPELRSWTDPVAHQWKINSRVKNLEEMKAELDALTSVRKSLGTIRNKQPGNHGVARVGQADTGDLASVVTAPGEGAVNEPPPPWSLARKFYQPANPSDPHKPLNSRANAQ